MSSATELKLGTGETPPQSLTVSVGDSLRSLSFDFSSPISHGGGAVDSLLRGFGRWPSSEVRQGVGWTSPPPRTPLFRNLLRPNVTNALTIESARRRAPVLCGGILPKALATSRSITACHFPFIPRCARSFKSDGDRLFFFVPFEQTSFGLLCIDSTPRSGFPQFSIVIHIQKVGLIFMLIPPKRTASLITVCSFSEMSRLQNLLTIFILHTATGSPSIPSIITTVPGSVQVAVSKGLGPPSGGQRYRSLLGGC
mmetsp:Transcript_19408/g.28754  ORF Transcript_19408/g.28754 Transcript_19408/m.28754 type:complete len:254 (+) Transcript_19408:970-1731(+)